MKDVTGRPSPVWAILVPVSEAVLRRQVREILKGLPRWSEGQLEDLDVLAGTSGSSAVVGYRPGSEGGVDLDLAKALSRRAEEEVHHLLLHDRFAGAEVVTRYRQGRRIRSFADSPFGFAADRGIDLRGDEGAVAYGPLEACLVEGASPEEVAGAFSSPAALERFEVEPAEDGTVLYGAGSSRLGLLLRDRLRHRVLYTIAVERDPLDFRLTIYRGGEAPERFAYPPREPDPLDALLVQHLPAGRLAVAGEPNLSSVRGETEPLAIVARLGLDPSRLGLS